MLLKHIAVSLALPPMSFLCAVISGHLACARFPRTGRTLFWVGVLAMGLFSLPAVSDLLLVPLETDLPLEVDPSAMPKAIVVLGGDVQHVGTPRRSRPGGLTLERLRAAADLRLRVDLPILVTGGGTTSGGRSPVGDVMAHTLRHEFQLPVKWVENQSADTWENARFSAAILLPLGIDTVYVVTDGWHMRRSVLAFRKAGFRVVAVPAAIDTLGGWRVWDFVPRVGSWQNTYYAFHEWFGLVWYGIR